MHTRKTGEVLRRFRSIGDAPAVGKDKCKRNLVIATNDPIDMGGWREILSMEDGAVDVSACRSLLVNHDPNSIAGRVDSISFSEGRASSEVSIHPDAKLETGISVADAVDQKMLCGVSIGYVYGEKDCTINKEERSVTVNKWRLLEVTLTPIPADTAAGVRSFPSPPVSQEEITMAEPVQVPAVDTEQVRAAARTEAKAIATQARSLGLAADDFVGLPVTEAKDAMLRAIAEKHKAQGADPVAPVAPRIEVTADAGDKLLNATRASLYERAGITPSKEEAESFARCGRVSVRNAIRHCAKIEGIDIDASEVELAGYASGLINLRTHGRRDAANKISSQFSTLLANVSNKAILQGMRNYNAATWQIWATVRNVKNFLQITNASLSSGRLVSTPENEAFPELLQKDGGYNSTLGMYGATVSLTFQALVNDELGMFMDDLKRSGYIAAETIDRQVYAKMLGATWTYDLSTSAGLATPANLDKPRAALRTKKNMAGLPAGIIGRYLIHDPANAVAAGIATGQIYGPGTTTAPSAGSRQIQTVESHWVSDTTLLGGAAITDYFLTGDPNAVDTVLVNFLEGVGQSPIIMPFDGGAVASERWKIMLPFEATVATHSDGTNTRVSGIQRATA
ncbi:MAG: HK97 family phage prohead protease [Betaproteobacteria bacterium]|nr:HK97 family phage prohead protease [Betaproteobacteria bacterium]